VTQQVKEALELVRAPLLVLQPQLIAPGRPHAVAGLGSQERFEEDTERRGTPSAGNVLLHHHISLGFPAAGAYIEKRALTRDLSWVRGPIVASPRMLVLYSPICSSAPLLGALLLGALAALAPKRVLLVVRVRLGGLLHIVAALMVVLVSLVGHPLGLLLGLAASEAMRCH
jgi:hypothetical protein